MTRSGSIPGAGIKPQSRGDSGNRVVIKEQALIRTLRGVISA